MLLKTDAPNAHLPFIIDALRYRWPIPVIQTVIFQDSDSYPICPRCDKSMPRDYMNFCDRCGQRLDWHLYDLATVVYAPRARQK